MQKENKITMEQNTDALDPRGYILYVVVNKFFLSYKTSYISKSALDTGMAFSEWSLDDLKVGIFYIHKIAIDR